MRLPWPFGRGTTSGEPAPAEVAGPAAAPSALPAVQRDAPPTGAWASLPPIQRTVSAAPLVAPAAPFLRDVPGHRPLPPIVQPLGHEQAPSAPAGLVVAHAAPAPVLTSTAPMPTRSVQRRAAAPAEPAWTGADTGDGEAPAPAPVRGPDPEPEPEPLRRVAPVAPAQAATPPARPLTEAPPIAASRPAVVQREVAASSAGTRAAASASSSPEPSLPLAPRGTAPARAGRWSEGPAAASRPGLAAPLPQLPPTAMPPSGPVQRSAAASNAGPAATPPPHRAGLGAPIPAVPPTAVQRSVPAELPLAHRIAAAHAATSDVAGQVALPTVAPAAGGHEGHAHGPASAAAGDGGSTTARALPVLPVAHRGGGPSAPVQRTASPAMASVQRSAASAPGGTAPPTILPLLGARPLRPSVAVQRDADAAVVPATPAEGPSQPVAARWNASDDLPATIHSSLAAPAGDAVPLQRLGAPEPVAVPAPAGPVEWTAAGGWHGAHSPSLGSPAQPGGGSGSVQRLPAPAATPRSRPAAQTSHDTPTLQLARPSSAPWQAPAPAPAAQAPVASRIEAAAPVPSSPSPTVQTSAAPAAGLPSLTVTPVVQRVEGTAPPVQGGQSGHTDRELDELAKQLFGRFRGQLRAEVITEREARGLGFDAF